MHSTDFERKIAILDNSLAHFGFEGIVLLPGKTDGFDEELAGRNRDKFLGSLKPEDYVGTILPQGMAPLPKK